MNVITKRRNFTDDIHPVQADFEVERYSKAAMGGPKQASIRVRGDDRELWRIIERVRAPIEIWSDKGDPNWWGYISDIEAVVLYPDRPDEGRVKVGVSIDNTYTAVAVAYALVDTTDGSKSRDTTSYFIDAQGTAEYGTKQLLWSPGAASAAHANAAGTAKLYQVRYPDPIITSSPEANESYAIINCRGWWDTMEWLYYANAGTSIVDTATQCGTIIATSGQFLNTIWQDVTSGITLIETRDGDNTADYYLKQMLQTGTNNYLRMLVDIDIHRNIRIYEEPAYSVSGQYRLFADGSFETPYGEPIRKENCPVAFWAKRVDAISATIDSTLLNDPSVLFIEEMEYNVKNDRLIYRARGDPDPWEFPVVRDG